jgi:hypothetical protein
LVAVGLLTAGVAVPALAQTQFPMPVQQGEVTYITGGIGQDEAQAMRASASAYNLLVSNARNDGSFTAGIDVIIRDGHGQTVLMAKDTGPLFYVRLPPGAYTMDALYNGIEKVKDVVIAPHRPAQINLIWPEMAGP